MKTRTCQRNQRHVSNDKPDKCSLEATSDFDDNDDTKSYSCEWCDSRFHNYKELMIHKKGCTVNGVEDSIESELSSDMDVKGGKESEEYHDRECTVNADGRNGIATYTESGTVDDGVVATEYWVNNKDLEMLEDSVNVHDNNRVINSMEIVSDLISLGNTAGYECNMCGKNLSKKSRLVRHIRDNHLLGRPHQCEICDKSFHRKNDLRWHAQEIHEQKKKFACVFCDKSYSRKSGLTRHVKEVHENREQKKPFTRDSCGRSYGRNSGLICHINTRHIKEFHKNPEQKKPFSCVACDKSYSRNSGLTRHVKEVHENHRPFKCDWCDKLFRRNSHLKKHARSHVEK